MKPAPFDYVRADNIEEALDVLAHTGGDARILAGGQSLLPMLNMRLARPQVVIDIMRVAALKRVDEKSGALIIHASVRQVEMERRPLHGLDMRRRAAAARFAVQLPMPTLPPNYRWFSSR